MALTFNLRGFGHAFATRGRGRELREKLLDELDQEPVVKIDFAGVAHISYSFADEFLGVLVADEGRALSVELANLEPSVDRVARDAIGRRRGEAVAC